MKISIIWKFHFFNTKLILDTLKQPGQLIMRTKNSQKRWHSAMTGLEPVVEWSSLVGVCLPLWRSQVWVSPKWWFFSLFAWTDAQQALNHSYEWLPCREDKQQSPHFFCRQPRLGYVWKICMMSRHVALLNVCLCTPMTLCGLSILPCVLHTRAQGH
jgi:hypothetical protein